MRDAPALAILPALLDKGAEIRAHDPQGMREASPLLPDRIHYADSIDEAVEDADALVLLTEWNQYRGLDIARVRERMRGRTFIDLRNVYERELWEREGFSYTAVGR
jgi:UDPglucose 6-dehydrogenase